MTLASSIKQFVENIARSARIISPRFADYRIEGFDFYSESGQFDETFKGEVIKIIQDEIKIQMTAVKQDEAVRDENPIGSVENQIVSNVQQGLGAFKNPAGLATKLLAAAPHAAIVLFAIQMIPIIITELTKAGGAYDIRWRRELEREVNGFLDRQTQKNTALGLRGVRIQSRAGFIQLNGAAAANTMDLAKNSQRVFDKNNEVGFDAFKVGYF